MMHHLIQLACFAANLWAEEGEGLHSAHHEAHGIPWDNLFVQGLNFFLLIGLLVYLMRKSVRAHFENRAREYQELVERAESARSQAEAGKLEIEKRLARLQTSSEQNVAQARSEAEELKARMRNEAEVLAKRLEEEARRTAQIELEKATLQLRKELLTRALAESRESLSKNLSSNEQKKLQNEFVEKIQVVGG